MILARNMPNIYYVTQISRITQIYFMLMNVLDRTASFFYKELRFLLSEVLMKASFQYHFQKSKLSSTLNLILIIRIICEIRGQNICGICGICETINLFRW